MTVGTHVTLMPGTRVGIDSGERFDWGGTKYDWHTVGDGIAADIEYEITTKGIGHATMTGGGYDWWLKMDDGTPATVRTTFVRNERATFKEAR